MNEYGRWALDQGLQNRESTLFLYKIFPKKIEQDQVDFLARDSANNNAPRHNSMLELVELVIKELNFDPNAERELQRQFMNFSLNNKNPVYQEFVPKKKVKEQNPSNFKQRKPASTDKAYKGVSNIGQNGTQANGVASEVSN